MHYKIVNYCGFSWSRKKRTGRLLHIDYVLLEKQCQQRPHACMDDFSTCFYISQVAENTQACIALYIYIERLFSFTQNLKKCYSTYHIEYVRSVHGALNVDEKKIA